MALQGNFTALIPQLLTSSTLSTISLGTENTIPTTCTAFGFYELYSYSRQWLVIPYSTAIAFAVLTIVFGMLSLRDNGGLGHTYSSRHRRLLPTVAACLSPVSRAPAEQGLDSEMWKV